MGVEGGIGGGLTSAVTLFPKALSWIVGDSPAEKNRDFDAKLLAQAQAQGPPPHVPKEATPIVVPPSIYVRQGDKLVSNPLARDRRANTVVKWVDAFGSVFSSVPKPDAVRVVHSASWPSAREPIGPPPVPPQPPDYPWLVPAIPSSGSPQRSTVYRAQQTGAPTQQAPQSDLDAAMDRLRRAFQLRDALISIAALFKRPKPPAGFGYPYPVYLPAPVAQTPGGVNVASMIPFFGSSFMPNVSGAGLGSSGGWGDLLGQLFGVGGGIAQQIIAQRPSQIPIPGPWGGITLPGYVPEGSAQVPGLFRTAERAVAQPFEVPNPITGRLIYYAPRGRPILFSGDFAACRRVQRVSAMSARRCGGRRKGR